MTLVIFITPIVQTQSELVAFRRLHVAGLFQSVSKSESTADISWFWCALRATAVTGARQLRIRTRSRSREESMRQYIIRRLAISIPILLGVTIITFVLTELMPGDYVDAMIPPDKAVLMSPERVQAMREAYGLDKPLTICAISFGCGKSPAAISATPFPQANLCLRRC